MTMRLLGNKVSRRRRHWDSRRDIRKSYADAGGDNGDEALGGAQHQPHAADGSDIGQEKGRQVDEEVRQGHGGRVDGQDGDLCGDEGNAKGPKEEGEAALEHHGGQRSGSS